MIVISSETYFVEVRECSGRIRVTHHFPRGRTKRYRSRRRLNLHGSLDRTTVLKDDIIGLVEGGEDIEDRVSARAREGVGRILVHNGVTEALLL